MIAALCWFVIWLPAAAMLVFAAEWALERLEHNILEMGAEHAHADHRNCIGADKS